MELKHTPGPWEIRRDNHKIISIGPVYASYGNRGYVWVEVSGDDARLVAAAPKMIAALIDAEEALSHLQNVLAVRVNPPTLENIRAVIAEATGAQA